MSSCIVGLGTASPPFEAKQEDALQMSQDLISVDDRQQRLMRVLFRKSGVENRKTCVPWQTAYSWKTARDENDRGPTTAERMQLYSEHAAPLALAASQSALENGGVERHEITHLITVSCTGFDAPGVDVELIASLGLRPTTQRTHVGYMGCHGAINGLRVAQALVSEDPARRVLLCAVELCSLHYRLTWDDEGIIGNALFADGAAAVVVADSQIAKSSLWEIAGTGSCLIPDSREAMSWRVGDHGFEMRLTASVPSLIEEHVAPWIASWLDQHGLAVGDIAKWAVHPGGPRILSAVETAIRLPADAMQASRAILRDFGNMSSPTILFILDKLREQSVSGPVVALAFGPGLAVETALLKAFRQ